MAAGRKASMNWLDRAVAAISPTAGLARLRARAAIQASADGYDVARPSRRRRRFTGSGGAADRHLDSQTLHQLRETNRQHDRNSSLLAGLLNTACDEIVGPRLTFKPTTKDEQWNKQAAAYIARRMDREACDHRGLAGYVEQVRTVLRSLWTDGDILRRWIAGGQVQTFEAHELVSPLNGLTADGRDIVNGVEMTPAGRPTGYYVQTATAAAKAGFVASLAETLRLDASECWMPAFRKRFGQSRGVPYITACMDIYDHLDGYLDSETVAAEISSRLGFQITRAAEDTTDLPGTETRSAGDPNETTDSVSTYEQLLRMEAGMIVQGTPGEEVKNIGGQRPTDSFEPYIVNVARIVGVGVGFPLELLLKDFSRTNYSSGRLSMNVAHRSFSWWQELLADHECRPWYRRQIALGIAAGLLGVPAVEDPQDAYTVRIVWPAWPYLDWQKEMAGNETAIRIGVKSRSQIIREMGGEPEETFGELDGEKERFPAPPPPPQFGQQKPGGQGPEKPGDQEEDQDEDDARPGDDDRRQR